MTPEALRRRMAHGNIYPSERVDAALANYFRPGNLAALRELALLWVADRVEEGLQQYLETHGIAGTWETRRARPGRHHRRAGRRRRHPAGQPHGRPPPQRARRRPRRPQRRDGHPRRTRARQPAQARRRAGRHLPRSARRGCRRRAGRLRSRRTGDTGRGGRQPPQPLAPPRAGLGRQPGGARRPGLRRPRDLDRGPRRPPAPPCPARVASSRSRPFDSWPGGCSP